MLLHGGFEVACYDDTMGRLLDDARDFYGGREVHVSTRLADLLSAPILPSSPRFSGKWKVQS
jgi:hypothetical protein